MGRVGWGSMPGGGGGGGGGGGREGGGEVSTNLSGKFPATLLC